MKREFIQSLDNFFNERTKCGSVMTYNQFGDLYVTRTGSYNEWLDRLSPTCSKHINPVPIGDISLAEFEYETSKGSVAGIGVIFPHDLYIEIYSEESNTDELNNSIKNSIEESVEHLRHIKLVSREESINAVYKIIKDLIDLFEIIIF